MEEKHLKEQQRTNELLEKLISQNQKQNDLLTAEQVHEQYDIGINTVRKMFKDEQLPVQRYTTPFKVARQALEEYMNVNHDYLSKKQGGDHK